MTRLSPLVALLLLVSSGALRAQQDADVDLPARNKFHLFLLVGQSNMAGRGKVEEEDRQAIPRVLMFTKDNRWAPAVDPLHFDKPRVVGVGLGRAFGRIVAEIQPDVTVGLIPCAVGGSPIDSWQPGGYHASTNSHPWDDAIKRAKIALQSGTLQGVLWHQGESDSKEGKSETYEKKLHELIARFRRELNAPDVPFIAGQMGQFAERPWDAARKQVDDAHRRLPERVPNSAFVSSDGLTHKGDEVHFDSRSYRELGQRYAAAYLALQVGQKNVAVGLPFRVERTVARSGFDGKRCWVHARAGAIPPRSPGNPSETPLVVMTMQKLLLSGSDVFYALHEMRTDDLGRSWDGPRKLSTFERQQLPGGVELTVCDFTPKWHAASGKLLGTGHTVRYQDNRVMHVRRRATAYAVYDHQRRSWSPWKTLELPDRPQFANAGAGSVQRVDLPDGDILLPFYFKQPESRQYSTTVCRCRFDGDQLQYVRHGGELTVDVKRGLYEPSLTRHEGRFYLTMRNDDHGYVSVSDDGLQYDPPRRWTFDDGQDLGNYNTQQHWVSHANGLFLVYTRRGADNDHVFRHRAPLFIARVDPQKLHVIRSTEQVLVPEHGARLGNFGVVEVSPQETWVTVAEWMQPAGVERYGSDNRVHVVKLQWRQ